MAQITHYHCVVRLDSVWVPLHLSGYNVSIVSWVGPYTNHKPTQLIGGKTRVNGATQDHANGVVSCQKGKFSESSNDLEHIESGCMSRFLIIDEIKMFWRFSLMEKSTFKSVLTTCHTY